MAFTVKLKDGTVVECETAKQVREVVGQLAGMVTGATPKKTPRRARNFKSPGEGPKRLWAMAEYRSVLTGKIKNDARSELAKIKRDDKRAFLDKEDEYKQFVAFYAKKTKTEPDAAQQTLRDLYEGDLAEFTKVAEEFSKKHSASAAPRRAGR